MKDLYVKLNSFQDVRDLANLATEKNYQIVISDGHHMVSAKSLMCIFSLDLSRPVLLQLECGDEEYERFRACAAAFVV